MALRNVTVMGDDVLRKQCREVTELSDRIQTLIEDMIETMHDKNGVGIAAPQVGIARKICVCEPEEDRTLVLINPEILESEGEQMSEEGCLSVPGVYGEVIRPERIKVRYMDRKGITHVEEFEGFDAIVVSHETDHLTGTLFVDKALKTEKLD